MRVNINEPRKPKLLDVFKSVAASVFGVQSAANRERDFQTESIVPYIVVGVIFVLGLILSLVLLVSIVLA